MASEYEWLREAFGARSDLGTHELGALASRLEAAGDVHTAATALDRAFAADPFNFAVCTARNRLLDRLSLNEHGILFRYIPAGTFLMGSDKGDADEQPIHPGRLGHYWLSETPISWHCYCRLMDWELPPVGLPRRVGESEKPDESIWPVAIRNRIRLQYCEDQTQRAMDWHAHAPEQMWKAGTKTTSSRVLFGVPDRRDPSQPWGYDSKPMVYVEWDDAMKLCSRLSQPGGANQPVPSDRGRTPSAAISYRLPTEAEWEKGARGGLVGRTYPWGDTPPTHQVCDFDRFDQFSVLPMKQFSPNDYGLYAMSGCVWEWTGDWYDAEFYAQSPPQNPRGPDGGKKRVVRGGSWSDCAEAVTVSFRMSLGGDGPPTVANPNIGFRICREDRSTE
jgi:sulfatase modifying factor 1